MRTRFQDLRYQQIHSRMSSNEIVKALNERRNWLDDCEENFSDYQRAVMQACISYGEKSFMKWINSADLSRYVIFNNVFTIALRTIGDEKRFFQEVENEFNYINRSNSNMRTTVGGNNVAQRNRYLLEQQVDQSSDIYQATVGLTNSIWAVSLCIAGIAAYKENYAVTILSVLAASVAQFGLAQRLSNGSTVAAMFMYNNDEARDQFKKLSTTMPKESFQRVMGFFGRGANAALTSGEAMVKKIEQAVDKAQALAGAEERPALGQ